MWPRFDATSGLSLCGFSSLLRGFFSGFSSFLPSPKTNIQVIPAGCELCSRVTHGPYSGCQRRHCKLSVRPCWAASLLYLWRRLATRKEKRRKKREKKKRITLVGGECYQHYIICAPHHLYLEIKATNNTMCPNDSTTQVLLTLSKNIAILSRRGHT